MSFALDKKAMILCSILEDYLAFSLQVAFHDSALNLVARATLDECMDHAFQELARDLEGWTTLAICSMSTSLPLDQRPTV